MSRDLIATEATNARPDRILRWLCLWRRALRVLGGADRDGQLPLP
jgi:hypothetical protein